jgi:hypothetical protein
VRSVRPTEIHLTERNDREDFAVIPNTIGMHATVIAVCFDEATSIETVLGPPSQFFPSLGGGFRNMVEWVNPSYPATSKKLKRRS